MDAKEMTELYHNVRVAAETAFIKGLFAGVMVTLGTIVLTCLIIFKWGVVTC